MRLLNTTTLLLEEYFGDSTPSYAILSHRWEGGEVTFQDLREGRGVDMAGYSKIMGCCRQAKLDGWQYAWVDSCCIDKSSSSELSEAINSMFNWYRDAEVCYAYLSDVEERSDFAKSQWFTRGWTLQELLAPQFLVFYDKEWIVIDTKLRLQKELRLITGITHLTDFENASVAQKMSWAARRTTTRIEDQAYCLMGIFGVNMPTLYGEGKGGFLRLQLKIIRMSDDETIFAWLARGGQVHRTGLLAPSADCFEKSYDIIRSGSIHNRSPFAMTNKGLRIETRLISVTISEFGYSEDWNGRDISCLMPLQCARQGSRHPIVLHVGKMEKNQFWRMWPFQSNELLSLLQPDLLFFREPEDSSSGPEQHICFFKQEETELESCYCFTVNLFAQLRCQYTIAAVMSDSKSSWKPVEHVDTTTIELRLGSTQNKASIIFSGGPVSNLYAFALFLEVQSGRPTVNIICKDQALHSERAVWGKQLRPNFDKLSRALVSGDVVSYVLKKGGRTGPDKNYVLDVTIDDMMTGGYSRFPVPDHDMEMVSDDFSSPLEKRTKEALEWNLAYIYD